MARPHSTQSPAFVNLPPKGRLSRLVLGGLCAALTLSAWPAAARAEPASGPVTVLRAARMLDVRSGRLIAEAVVVIQGETIKAAGSGLALPKGARVIDLGEATLLPGLIDCHTHLLQNYDPDPGGDASLALTVATMSTARRALLGAAMGREDLEAGITTVRDVGNSGWNGDVALRDAIDQGWVAGPRVFASTRALAPLGGQFGDLATEAQPLVAQEYATVGGAESARQAVRQAFFDGADLIKVIVNAGPRVLGQDELDAIVAEAHRAGKRVAAHATSDLATRLAARAGVDSIEHAYEVSDDTLAMMAQKRIYLVPTDYPAEFYLALLPSGASAAERARQGPRVQAKVAAHRERLARAIRLGVPIAFGSDEYYQLAGDTRGEASLMALRAYQASGLSPLETLRAATIGAADLLGQADRLGSIEAGKAADVIAVDGDPLKDVADLRRVRFVMKAGRVFRDDAGAARPAGADR